MNIFLIVGIVLGVLAAASTGYGTYTQIKKDTMLNEKLDSYVVQQEEKDRPLLHIVNASIRDLKEVTLFINNSGERQADKTSIIFTFHHNKVLEGMKIILPVIPKGTTRTSSFDVWQTRLVDGGIKSEDYDEFLEEYIAGKKALVAHFYLEYENGETLYKTGKYAVLLSSDGMFHFSKIED